MTDSAPWTATHPTETTSLMQFIILLPSSLRKVQNMKCDKKYMLLYAVTDRAWVGKQSLYEQVESALKGGATCVQLREKELNDDEFLAEAIEIGALCRKYSVPFFVNEQR